MILISAGHYADKPGAHYAGSYEYPETTVWAALIMSELQRRHVPCALVPNGRLGEKISFVNKQEKPALAIEVHFNSDVDHAGTGCETLYCPGSVLGEVAAGFVQARMAGVMGHNRGIKEGWYRLDPARGIDRFLKATKCPALIVEPEFIHNFDLIFVHRYRCAEAIVDGVVDFLEVAGGTVKRAI